MSINDGQVIGRISASNTDNNLIVGRVSAGGTISGNVSSYGNTVTSVNNVRPDRNGNVTLEVGSGKSAYEYAQDGGYTGTEEEFSVKLATECPIPDWDQTDENASDYIKNKPDELDALETAAEVGFVEPVAVNDGSIYTDENGAIYVF